MRRKGQAAIPAFARLGGGVIPLARAKAAACAMLGPMRLLTPLALAAALSGGALAERAHAEQALDGDAFEALVEGRTLTYGGPGQKPYGVEHYFAGRHVAWAWQGSDECLPGTWREEKRPDGPAICFDYEHDPEPKCWRVFREGAGLRATFLNDGSASALYEIVDQPGSLVCGGAGV